MKKPKTKLKRRRRSVKPVAKRKRKVTSRPATSNPKKVSPAPGACLTSAAALPELEPIPSRPLFDAPRHSYFLGGGVAMPAGYLPEGFVLASAPKPAAYRAAEFRSYRTFPDGEFLRCVRYELKPGTVSHDFKAEEMPYIPKGNVFFQNGTDGPFLAVRCPCNNNVIRVRAVGWTRCHKCGLTYTAPTDCAGLPIVNSQALKNSFSYDAAKLPRDRTS